MNINKIVKATLYAILILSILLYCDYTVWVHQDIKSACFSLITAHLKCMCMQIGLDIHGSTV